MTEDVGKHSCWMLRALEWDDPRARYPNVWHGGMPRQVLAVAAMASRLRLGDTIAVYHPASQRHPDRAERFVGLSCVIGLQRAHASEFAWIELETVHRFQPSLDLREAPRRVLLCCDEGWPLPDVALFRRVWAAAEAAGWKPERHERAAGQARAAPARDRDETLSVKASEPPAAPDELVLPPRGPIGDTAIEPQVAAEIFHLPASEGPPLGVGVAEAVLAPPETAVETKRPRARPEPRGRLFAGVDYSGDMRDPREGTWLAVVELHDDRLRVTRLEATGRSGLEAILRNADAALRAVEAIGLDFPFSLPLRFAEAILDGPFPETNGWWSLARRLERMTRPEYLTRLHSFREAEGELKRYTDEAAGAFSPLHRVNPDLGPMTYHGIRMIAEERSRFAVRPFESALGRLLLEVYPGGLVRRLAVPQGALQGGRPPGLVAALAAVDTFPVDVDRPFLDSCLRSRDALDAVMAARCTAVAVLGGEVDASPGDLAPEAADRIRKEGWIYGLAV